MSGMTVSGITSISDIHISITSISGGKVAKDEDRLSKAQGRAVYEAPLLALADLTHGSCGDCISLPCHAHASRKSTIQGTHVLQHSGSILFALHNSVFVAHANTLYRHVTRCGPPHDVVTHAQNVSPAPVHFDQLGHHHRLFRRL
jgi:hypothetical protein